MAGIEGEPVINMAKHLLNTQELVKISNEREIYVNPQFVNGIVEFISDSKLGSEVSTCYTRYLVELDVKEILNRLYGK